MAATVAYTLREDKQELKKQLGCMNGIFQLFDRRYLLGQHRHGRSQRRLTPGQTENGEKEFDNASENHKWKSSKKAMMMEQNRASIESSRNSFSSSCSSTTFSSFDCSKRVQTEPTSPNLHKKQPELSLQPPDIRDVVKDSMTRETRVLSVKTMAKDERAGPRPAMKHIDSPRPLEPQRPVRYYRKDGNLANLEEASPGVKEVKETARFSCDGRESRYLLQSALKVKELPRLSLDSKQKSIGNAMNESRRSLVITQIQRSGQTLNQSHEPGSNKRPSSDVVARLMGLERLTDSVDEVEPLKIKPSSNDELVSSSRWSRKGEELEQNHGPVSPRERKELASFERQCGNEPMREPPETAWWKQEGGNRGSQKAPLKNKEAPVRPHNGFPSVYGEMEKRLTKLEFKTSGKDLRALKQILEAMQTTRRESQSQKSYQPVSPTIKATSPMKKHEPLSTAKKPAKITDSTMIADLQKVNHAESRKDLLGKKQIKEPTPTNKKATGMTQRSASPSTMPEYLTGEKSTLSPRPQRSKDGINKQSIHGPSSDLSRIKRQPNMQPVVSDLKTRNLKTKSTNPLQNNKQSCRCNIETRKSSKDGDTVTFKSESNTSLAYQNDSEVTRTDKPKENHRNNFAERLIEDKPMVELAKLTMEQPSPVSVLDAFYIEDTPSPVMKKHNAFNDYGNLHLDETEWKQDHSSEFNHVNLGNRNHNIHQIELLNSTNDDATINDTATSPPKSANGDHRYISEILLASGFLTDLDSATRLVQLHPMGALINPTLFHALETSKGCTELTDENPKKNTRSKSNEKIRRKLVFDSVNEILFHKLAMSGSSRLWTGKRQGGLQSGEKLLTEMCSDIDDLQTSSERCLYDEDDEVKMLVNADVNKRSEDWDRCRCEVPGLVLDIERLIFKDLISEVVYAEAAILQDWSGRHCRQLFPM